MIEYVNTLKEIKPKNLKGFFAGWQSPPSPKKHLRILENSDYVVIAVDKETGNVVGFVNALSDKTFYSYIPFLEVLPDYQSKGIATKLMNLMLEKLKHYYAIDICCDEKLYPFFRKFDFNKVAGMIKRNYGNKNGKANI